MNYIQKILKSCWTDEIGNSSRIRVTRGSNFDEQIVFYYFKTKQITLQQYGVQDLKIYNLEDCIFCLENKENEFGVNCSLESSKNEI